MNHCLADSQLAVQLFTPTNKWNINILEPAMQRGHLVTSIMPETLHLKITNCITLTTVTHIKRTQITIPTNTCSPLPIDIYAILQHILGDKEVRM